MRRARRRTNAMQKIQERQCDDVQWEHEPECLGPKSNRVLGGGKGASERVNRRCDERLLEAVRLEVITPGMAASEEWGGCAMMIRAAAGHLKWSVSCPDERRRKLVLVPGQSGNDVAFAREFS